MAMILYISVVSHIRDIFIGDIYIQLIHLHGDQRQQPHKLSNKRRHMHIGSESISKRIR